MCTCLGVYPPDLTDCKGGGNEDFSLMYCSEGTGCRVAKNTVSHTFSPVAKQSVPFQYLGGDVKSMATQVLACHIEYRSAFFLYAWNNVCIVGFLSKRLQRFDDGEGEALIEHL